MLTIEQIVALLGKKIPGVRKDALQSVAGVIALQAEDEAAAQTIVDQMTAEKVQGFAQTYHSNIDREIQQSNQTYEQTLRNKYNFVEKQQQQQQQQQQQGPVNLDQLKNLFAEALAPLTQRMDAYDQQRIGASRREMYVGKMKEANVPELMQNSLLQQFDRMTFRDDTDFNQFLADSQPTFAQIVQNDSDARLRQVPRPFGGGGGDDTKGVSQAMKDYLESKKGGGNVVEGKAL